VSQPDILQLLVDTAIQPELRRRLAEAPESVFEQYALTEEQRELLLHPDHRLLPLLGAAMASQAATGPAPAASPEARPLSIGADPTIPEGHELRDSLMALTIVPCLTAERIAFVAWLSPMPEGADPSRFPMPAATALPGPALTPLHAVIQITAAQSKDACGNPHLSMWASFRQHTNAATVAPPETAGNPDASPFASPIGSAEIEAAAAEVRAAAPADRYDKLVTLLGALRGGDVR
jgi:hypothetical protein